MNTKKQENYINDFVEEVKAYFEKENRPLIGTILEDDLETLLNANLDLLLKHSDMIVFKFINESLVFASKNKLIVEEYLSEIVKVELPTSNI